MREKRNKDLIGEFGQTKEYREILAAIEKLREIKRAHAIERRQERETRKRAETELRLLYDDVRSVHPGLTYEEFLQVYSLVGLARLERLVDRMGTPPNRGLDF